MLFRKQKILIVYEKIIIFTKHSTPGFTECFVVLTGKFLVVEFDDHGTVVEHSIISAGSDTFGVEIPPRVWHCILPLEPGSVVYEIKEGPYSPIDDKNFAPWAPREGDTGCEEYMEQLLRKCGL